MSSALSPTDRARRRVALALRAVVLFVFGVFFVVIAFTLRRHHTRLA